MRTAGQKATTWPTQETSSIVNHVRTKQKPAGGRPGYSARHFARVTNRPIEALTICGAAATAYDLLPRDAAQTLKNGMEQFERWLRCSDCRRIVESEF